MSDPIIYHGTPLTPRAALNALLPGRAACVSFWRPDDAEAVEAVFPRIMFRQRRVFRMAGGDEARRTLVHPRGLDAVLSLARAPAVHARPMGSHSRCAWSAVPAQRYALAGLAVRRSRRASLAHGWADRAAAAPLRPLPARVPGLDRAGNGAGLRSMVPANGRGRGGTRQPLAGHPHDARRPGRAGIPLQQRGRFERRAERTSL